MHLDRYADILLRRDPAGPPQIGGATPSNLLFAVNLLDSEDLSASGGDREQRVFAWALAYAQHHPREATPEMIARLTSLALSHPGWADDQTRSDLVTQAALA